MGVVGHRRQGEADVVNFAPPGEQAVDQRLLHRAGIGPEVVPDDDPFGHAAGLEQSRDPKADALQAHQVDFLWKQPARVVLAKTRWLDQGQAFEFSRVGFQVGTRRGQHRILPLRSLSKALSSGLQGTAGAALRDAQRAFYITSSPASVAGSIALIKSVRIEL